jgi:hypothetical protein
MFMDLPMTLLAPSSRPVELFLTVCGQGNDENVMRANLLSSWASEAEGLRCKDCFQARMFFECILLGGNPEQRSDELRLPLRITSRQPLTCPLLIMFTASMPSKIRSACGTSF